MRRGRFFNFNIRRKIKSFRRAPRHKVLIVIIAVIVGLILIMIAVNSSLKPVVMTMAEQYGSRAVESAVNEAISDVFDAESVEYSDIVTLSYNDSGYVTAAEYDSAKINRLKAMISEALGRNLEKLKSSKIKIPLGSLTGDLNLSGRGPGISVKISQVSVPDIQIVSNFESVGINTVKNEIIVTVTVDSEIYLPPDRAEFRCTQDFVIAQTIIVGDIPSGYADIS